MTKNSWQDTSQVRAKLRQVFIQSLIIEAVAVKPEAELLDEGVSLYQQLDRRTIIRKWDRHPPVNQESTFAYLHMTFTQASHLASILTAKEPFSGGVKSLSKTGQSEVQAVFQAGLQGDAIPLVLHRPIYRKALLNFPWAENIPAPAHHALHDLVSQPASTPEPHLGVLIAGLLSGVPAHNFSTLIGLPDGILEGMIVAELEKGRAGV